MKKRVTFGVLLVLLAVAGYWQFRRPALTPEAQIRRLLAKAEQGAESQSVSACMGCVSQEYTDSLGNTNRTLRQLALQGFYTADSVDVTVNIHELKVTDDQARVVAEVMIMAAGKGQPADTTWSDMILYLAREQHGWRREWKIVRVEGWNLPEMQGY